MPRRWFPDGVAGQAYFCVVGSPIAHSKSPLIHAAFATQLGLSLRYERIEVAAGELAAALAEFRAYGGRGMNVTVPLKEEAWQLAATRTARAEQAGAANTLWFTPAGTVAADNTDGAGLVRDLVDNHGVALAGRQILLLGAGGAARGVVPALLDAAPAGLAVSNRTAARAEALCAAFATRAALEVIPWGALPARAPDVVINATTLSMRGEVPPLPATLPGAGTVYYDMMYGNEPTAFVRWARAHGALRALDGLGMLVEQAAEAFLCWHGVRPDSAPVIAALRHPQDGA
ncbi:MAG: shikimate dehydrogenase [Gammaproteobacteria bacterium]